MYDESVVALFGDSRLLEKIVCNIVTPPTVGLPGGIGDKFLCCRFVGALAGIEGLLRVFVLLLDLRYHESITRAMGSVLSRLLNNEGAGTDHIFCRVSLFRWQ